MNYTLKDAILYFTIGFITSLVIGYPSYRRKCVTRDGFIVSLFIGSIIFMTGWQTYLILLFFFISSTILTRWKADIKKQYEFKLDIGGRNWKQAIGASAGTILLSLILIFSLMFINYKKILSSLFIGLVSTIAVSNADTWAVEIGALSKNKPRLITKPWIVVDKGVSGGVTLLGEFASILGSFTIALISTILYLLSGRYSLSTWYMIDISPSKLFITVFLAGWIGEILDSIIGANLQVKYFCPQCNKYTDREVHRCGSKTKYISGLKYVKNETVNLIVTVLIGFTVSFLMLL